MKFQLLCLSGIFFLSISSFAQTSGGPDKYGYVWTTNFDPQGAAYNWKDIKDTANLITGLKDDNASKPISLGYYYNYYGKYYNTIWIGSNGWISFNQNGNISAPFPTIPSTSSPNNYIAALLSDLTFIDSKDSLIPGAVAYFWSNQSDSAIIQYDSVPFWDSSAVGYSGRCTFQIILVGSEYSIKLQYKNIINSTPPYNFNASGLRIGIEDTTGSDGLLVMSDTMPSDSLAIKFYSPGTFSTNNLENATIFLGQNKPNPSVNFTNIEFRTPNCPAVIVSIYNSVGSLIESQVINKSNSSLSYFSLNTQYYPSGNYFYSISACSLIATKKMIVVK